MYKERLRQGAPVFGADMPPRTKQPPAINAPWPVAAFALVLLAAHLIRVLLPDDLQNAAFYFGAVIPERFWGSGADMPPYASGIEAFLPTILSAFLHGDWMHVVLNAAFFVALGKPLLELFRAAWRGAGPTAFLILLGFFFASQIGAVMSYLLMNNPSGYPSIGASGGLSGMIAGVLLVREGPVSWSHRHCLWSETPFSLLSVRRCWARASPGRRISAAMSAAPS
jgi:membrane associated rhomboid family serine protease